MHNPREKPAIIVVTDNQNFLILNLFIFDMHNESVE
jgi:hypothetical protein